MRTCQDIDSYYARLRESAEYSAALAASQCYAFLEPLPRDFKRKVVRIVPGLGGTAGYRQEQEVIEPCRIVYQDRLADFCRDYNLNEDAMRAVGMGEREEYRGWRRAQSALRKVKTDPCPEDFVQVAPKGRQVGVPYRPLQPEQVAEQLKAQRECEAPQKVQVRHARFRETTVYGED